MGSPLLLPLVVLVALVAGVSRCRPDARVTQGRSVRSTLLADEVPVVLDSGVQGLYTPPPKAPKPSDRNKNGTGWAFDKKAADGVIETAFPVELGFEVKNALYTHYSLGEKEARRWRKALQKDVAAGFAVPANRVRVNAVHGVRFDTEGASKEERVRLNDRQKNLAKLRATQKKSKGKGKGKPKGKGKGGASLVAVDESVEFNPVSGVAVNVTVFAKTPTWCGKIARDAFNKFESHVSFPLANLMKLPLDARANNARDLTMGFEPWSVRMAGVLANSTDDITSRLKRLEDDYQHMVQMDPRILFQDLSPAAWRLDKGDIASVSVSTETIKSPYEQSLRLDSLKHDGCTVSRLLPNGFDGVNFRFSISYYDDSVGDQRNDWVGIGHKPLVGEPAFYHDYAIGVFHDPFHYSVYPAWRKTPVKRTVGWHLFELLGNDKQVHYFIDGQHVYTQPARPGFLTGMSIRGEGGTVAYWTPYSFYKPRPIKNW